MSSLSHDLGRDGDALVLTDHGRRWLECRAPDAVLWTTVASDVPTLLREVDARARSGACSASPSSSSRAVDRASSRAR
jgi:hypothetical protein